ncbi:MAG: hypothetical protein VYA57_00390 [Candidatus Thermoplasmatota archaeon]|nr:hypothetical protein [Candidatus Thermoplasmatota archaeon]MEE2647181.1 hypothetical protein [Candidatus Thermoplasmatota archaeon]
MIEMTAAPTHPPWRNAGIVPRTRGIDPALIQPLPGQLYHLSGPGRSGKSMRGVAEHWVAQALAEGRVVHWVDGACRIDPARFIPLLEALGAGVEACLARLYLSRGFTLHQLDRQLERLPDELAITRSPMVVVDGLLTMHSDDAVSSLESRTLLRRHVAVLRRLAHRNQTAVVAITGVEHGRCDNAQHVRYVRRHAQSHLEGTWRGRRRHRMLHLLHPRTGLQGPWLPFHEDAQTVFLLPRQRLNPHEKGSAAEVLALHHPER